MTGIALVTGANKGIGYEIAARLTEDGWTVLVGARDRERREQAVEKLRAGGGDARPLALDVTDPASVAEAATVVERDHGRLDVLVNNAGISGGHHQEPGVVDLSVVRTVFDTNVFGLLAVTEAMLPLLRRAPAARIVNVSSTVGSLAAPLADRIPASLAYPPSKTAVNAITAQYAKHLAGTGILVNAACPGWCATDFTGHQPERSAAQGADVVVRLATLGADGPTGGFFDDAGPVPW